MTHAIGYAALMTVKVSVMMCYLPTGVNAMLRKVAGAAASKPHVEIRQNGEQFYIKTSTTVRTTEINFLIGQEFNEETVDGRKCKVKSLSLPPYNVKVVSAPI
jgi:hypothetical protein